MIKQSTGKNRNILERCHQTNKKNTNTHNAVSFESHVKLLPRGGKQNKHDNSISIVVSQQF